MDVMDVTNKAPVRVSNRSGRLFLAGYGERLHGFADPTRAGDTPEPSLCGCVVIRSSELDPIKYWVLDDWAAGAEPADGMLCRTCLRLLLRRAREMGEIAA